MSLTGYDAKVIAVAIESEECIAAGCGAVTKCDSLSLTFAGVNGQFKSIVTILNCPRCVVLIFVGDVYCVGKNYKLLNVVRFFHIYHNCTIDCRAIAAISGKNVFACRSIESIYQPIGLVDD